MSGMVEDVGQSNTLYLSIAGGRIVKKCKESDDDPRIQKREWELKSGETGVAYEIPFKNLNGYITNIKIEDGKFGTQCRVYMSKGDENVILTINFESNYFSDFAKRICGADLSKPVTLNAYSFEDDDGRLQQGIAVEQDGEKLKSFFYDPEKKKTLHGIPSVTAKQREEYNKKKSKWKIHFAQERDFLSDCVVALNFSEHNKLPGDPGTSTMVDDSDDLEPQAETPAGVDKLPWEE